MNLRKINAVVGLITTILLMDHAIFHAAWMLSRGSIHKGGNTSFIMYGLMMVHAIISIVSALLSHKGVEKHKYNGYGKMNMPTYIQRFSGVALIIFTALHVAGTLGIMQPPPIVHAIVPPLFFAIALIHVAISASKSLITLGIGNLKFLKVIDIAVKVICGVTLIADVAGFYLFLV